MVSDTASSRESDVWLFRILALLLVCVPLLLGTQRVWAVGLMSIAIGALLVASWLALIRQRISPLACLAPARVPLGALVAYGALVAAQWLGDWDGEWLISVDPFQTLYYLICTLTYTATFVLIVLLARSGKRIRSLSLVLVASGVAQAVLAITLLSTGAEYQIFFEDFRHGGRAMGSFSNNNHLAAYLYLCLAVGIGLLIASLGGGGALTRGWRNHLVEVLAFMLSRRMMVRVLLVVMVVALVLTRSRMGNAAFFASLIVLGAIIAITHPALRFKALVLVASLVIVDIVIVGQWVGLDRVIERLENTAVAIEDERRGHETVEQRLQSGWNSLPLIAERLLTGWGGGSYHTAFPQYKSRDMVLNRLYFNHAHNDYIEIVADTGLLGLSLLALVVLSSLHRVWRFLSRHGQSAATKGVAYAGLMAISALLLHSLVDFNLQIPANALTITSILAMLWATPLESRSGRSGRPRKIALDGAPAAQASGASHLPASKRHVSRIGDLPGSVPEAAERARS